MNSIARVKGRLLLLALAGFCAARSEAGTISGSFEPIAAGSNVDLTILGKLDWVHWGLQTDSSISRKSGTPPLISDYSVLGTGLVYPYQYSDNANGYTWYDGSPSITQTNTTTGVWAYQAYPPELLGSGFQITAPADTDLKTLQVFVGTFAARGQFQATLSDGGLPYTDSSLFNSGNGPGGVYVLNYKANTPGQTLTVKWTLSQRAAGTNSITGNVTLQAAALTRTNANNPPFTTLISPASELGLIAPADIHLEAAAQDFDGYVTNVAFYSGSTRLGQTGSAPYTLTWTNPAVGHYFLTSLATDNLGSSRGSAQVEMFICTNGGMLSGSVKDASPTADLTTEGTLDWVHWGLVTNTSVDRKSGVSQVIPAVNLILTNPVQRYSDNFTSFSWNDGTPTLATNGTTTGIFVSHLDSGFRLTLPADPEPRTARFYVGGYGVQANFEAYLSDFSALPYIDNSVSNVFDNSYVVYTLNYASASPGQFLSITYSAASLFDVDFGNVTWQAVTLQGPAATLPVIITNAFRMGDNFVLRFTTQTNRNYTVQFTESLGPPFWNDLVTLPGTGAILSVTNQAPAGDQRYYRVRVQ